VADEGFNVLIVDDNEMNRDTLTRRLRQQGFASSMANNGREALEKVREQSYDLILLDIMMPEIDGFEVLQIIKADAELCKIPVIMISAMEEIESVMKCMEMGAEDYLTKPFDPVLLQAAIARCLKKSPSSSATPAPLPAPRQPLPTVPNTSRTTLQVPTGAEIKNRVDGSVANSMAANTEALPIEEVVTRILSAGRISRKGYRHLSNSLYNSLFNRRLLTESELQGLQSLFQQIFANQIKIID
jgi:DNA-binding response OmpR family regulator